MIRNFISSPIETAQIFLLRSRWNA